MQPKIKRRNDYALWLKILKENTPTKYQQYIEVIDLRYKKNISVNINFNLKSRIIFSNKKIEYLYC